MAGSFFIFLFVLLLCWPSQAQEKEIWHGKHYVPDNPMQSRFVNGMVTVTYTDGSSAQLSLRNPENWWPLEQDYFVDGFAFTTDAPKPPRVYLKSGTITRNFTDFVPIKGFSDFGIDGGAATIVDLPLNPKKKLKKMEIRTFANDVVIGLMGVTLLR